jgi:hypothetical protein
MKRTYEDLTDAGEPLVAYVYGDTPPDFAAIAASGFAVVCLDSLAPWFNEATIASARAHGLMAAGHPMSHAALKPTTFRR